MMPENNLVAFETKALRLIFRHKKAVLLKE
jgi:hypothetical protein